MPAKHSLLALLLNPPLTPKIITGHPQYWVSLILFICFIVFVFIKIYYRKPFRQIFRAFFFPTASTREEFGSSGRSSIFLSLLFVLNTALFIYQVYCYYYGIPQTPAGLSFYFKAVGVILIAYFIKTVVVWSVGHIFRTPGAAAEYIYTLFLFIKSIGVMLLPVTIGLAFMPDMPALVLIVCGWLIIGGAFVVRTLKVSAMNLQNKAISGFYLFLYLCTLEFLPLVVLIKVFMNNVGLFS